MENVTTKAKILVVEDENIVALDIKSMLERLGYHVSALVSSGERAIQKAAEMRPDLVLMDINLKQAMDGVEAHDTPVSPACSLYPRRQCSRLQPRESLLLSSCFPSCAFPDKQPTENHVLGQQSAKIAWLGPETPFW